MPLQGICLLTLIKFKKPIAKNRLANTIGKDVNSIKSIQEKKVKQKAVKKSGLLKRIVLLIPLLSKIAVAITIESKAIVLTKFSTQ